MSPCRFRIGLAATLLLTTAAAVRAEPPAVDVPGLIDKLAEVAEGDDDISWDLFLPLVRGGAWAGGMPHQKQAPSDALRALAKQGAAAVPLLLDHLDDKRPTKLVIAISLGAPFSLGGGSPQAELCDDNIRTTRTSPNQELAGDGALFETPGCRHVVTVGDLCFVALGQVVNRQCRVVYVPKVMAISGVTVVSPTDSPVLAEAMRKEWAGLTPERHKAALIDDFLKPDSDQRRIGACQRLAYYYPGALEPLALTFLARPTFDWYDVERFVQDRLYAAGGAKEQHKLFDDYVAKHGEVARDGIRLQLYQDLRDLKNAERAGRQLVELYGKPKQFKSDDVRLEEWIDPLSSGDKARVIEEGLIYDDSPKIDAAVRDLLAGIDDDDYFATACMARLLGRGFDEDIAKYCRRRLPLAATDEDKRLLQVWLDRAGWTRLHVAVERGTMDEIHRRIAEKVDVNAAAKDGRTALHLAAAEGDLDVVQALLDARADLNPRDATGTTPVGLAARKDNEEVVLLLADRGCELPDILSAAIAGKTEVVKSLLKKEPKRVAAMNAQGATPLHLAARRGHDQTAAALLASGADPNALNNPTDQIAPLHLAVATGNRKIVELLLDHGADPNIGRDGEDGSPLHLAVNKDQPDIAALLLDKGADPDLMDKAGWTPLHLAAQAGGEDVARVLLDHKANVGAKGKEGSTPLHEAAAAGHRKVVELLLERNADVNAKDGSGNTALHVAAREDHPEVFGPLLDKGAAVDSRNDDGRRPLSLAVEAGDRKAVKALLDHGAAVDATNDQGSTALHWAAYADNADVIEELLVHGANINAHDSNGSTPLHVAVEMDCVAAVKALLAHKADPTHENGRELTPLEMLEANGERGEHAAEIKRLLEEALPKK